MALGQQPRNDFHQHLLSPAVARFINASAPFLAKDLIAKMDAAGLQRALVLSLAYQFGNPHRPAPADEYALVRAENDWTAQQVRLYPTRLNAVCGVDPLRDYALAEIDRCSKDPNLRSGLKLHFGNSDVDLDNPEHVKKLRQVFRAADVHGMAIVIHMHANVTFHRPYGRHEAEIFLRTLLPEAPHSFVQIAHLAGSGGFDDPATDEALHVFIQAIGQHDARVAHVLFDISGVAGIGDWDKRKNVIAARIRAIGVERILFGCDGAWTNFTPVKAIEAYRQLPLTPAEFHTIDTNVPPYFTTR